MVIIDFCDVDISKIYKTTLKQDRKGHIGLATCFVLTIKSNKKKVALKCSHIFGFYN